MQPFSVMWDFGRAVVIAVAGTSFGLLSTNRALHSKNVALREKDRALVETRKTIDNYVETVQNAELLKEERFKPLLKDLLAGALAHYQRFINDYDHGDEQLADLAIALGSVAQISQLSGDTEKAIEANLEAIGVGQRIVDQFPQVAEHRHSLATDYVNIGGLYTSTGRADEAFAAYVKGQEILKILFEEDPSNSAYEGALASINRNLGTLYAKTDQPEQALVFDEKAIAFHQKLVTRFPQRPLLTAESYVILPFRPELIRRPKPVQCR